MCTCIIQLTPESRDLSQAEKRITEYVKLSKFRKMTMKIVILMNKIVSFE